MPEWLQNPYVVFGMAIGAMFFGYFFGLFEGRGQGYKRRKEEEAERKETEPAPEQELPAEPLNPPGGEPVLDVSKDQSGQFRLTLDGQRTDPTTLSVDQRKRLIEILTHMRPWLEAPKSGQSLQRASSPKEVPPPTPPKPVSPPSTTSPTSTPNTGPQPAVSPLRDDDEDVASAVPDSIVAQIDSILRSQIAGTPLMEKGIRLQESPEGGVIVWVGMSKFQGVEDVPDEEIKAAIRAAISVWESKYTPGL